MLQPILDGVRLFQGADVILYMVLNSSAKNLYSKFLDFREKELERKEHYLHEITQGREAEERIADTVKDSSMFDGEVKRSLHDIESSEHDLVERLEARDVSSLDSFFSSMQELHVRNMEEIRNVSTKLDDRYRKPTSYNSSAPFKGYKRSVQKELYRDILHLHEGLVYESRMIEIYFRITQAMLEELRELEDELTLNEKIERKRDGGSSLGKVTGEEKEIRKILDKLENNLDKVEKIIEEFLEVLGKNYRQSSDAQTDLEGVGMLTQVMKTENVEKLRERSLGGPTKFNKLESKMEAYTRERGRIDNMIDQLRSKLGNA